LVDGLRGLGDGCCGEWRLGDSPKNAACLSADKLATSVVVVGSMEFPFFLARRTQKNVKQKIWHKN